MCCGYAAELAQVCDVPDRPESAVVSVILGAPEVALAAATACLDRGVRVGCFRPPTVPAGTSRLRLTARASLSEDEMTLARTVLTEVLRDGLSVLVVTGTDTGVGKTVATAALACHARLAGIDVAVCKPVQTGSADGDDDLADIGAVVRCHRIARSGAPSRAVGACGRRGAGRNAAADPRRDLGSMVAAWTGRDG